jgi:hypothetical protein
VDCAACAFSPAPCPAARRMNHACDVETIGLARRMDRETFRRFTCISMRPSPTARASHLASGEYRIALTAARLYVECCSHLHRERFVAERLVSVRMSSHFKTKNATGHSLEESGPRFRASNDTVLNLTVRMPPPCQGPLHRGGLCCAGWPVRRSASQPRRVSRLLDAGRRP